MINVNHPNPHDAGLQAAAREEVVSNGFEPDFPAPAMAQVSALSAPAAMPAGVRDLRKLAWSSIDNPESKDLDQVEWAEKLPDGGIRLLVGIADVDALVPKGSPVDDHAEKNTTSLYLGVAIFPMLPEQLSTDLTSLVQDEDRLAHVVEIRMSPDGTTTPVDMYRAMLRNVAKLDYPTVGAWLAGHGPVPGPIKDSAELQAQVKLQNDAALALKKHRFAGGALNIESIEPRAVISDGKVVDIVAVDRNLAQDLIEELMVAANTSAAEILMKRGVSVIRRIVQKPRRWDRIVALAADLGTTLPAEADGKALADFMTKRQQADPQHFPDLSLTVVKLLGAGEYVLDRASDPNDAQEHFGLAVAHYVHSTAPNRRFVDLVTLRMAKAIEAGSASPYSDDELDEIAKHCTERERASDVAERTMRKRIAATALASHIGETFGATVTGKSDKGTFVRVFKPPLEGMLTSGATHVDVGDTVNVKLVATDPKRGYIDFSAGDDGGDGGPGHGDRMQEKRRAAEALRRSVGLPFDVVVTTAGPKGVWARFASPPAGVGNVEGRIMRGAEHLQVGDTAKVRLTGANSVRGFIDFEVVS